MNQTNTALILQGAGYGVIIDPAAETAKAQLLKTAALIVEVNDPIGCDAARVQIGLLADMRIAVEKSRKTVKEPVLQIGRDIDSKAADFAADIQLEEARLKRLMADYAAVVEAERQRIMRELEAKRAEEQRLAREAEAARQKAEREAEAARIAAEEAARKSEDELWNATTTEDEERAQENARIARLQAEQEAQLAAARAEAVCDAALAGKTLGTETVVIPQAVKGTKFVTDYEVTDIHALYQHNTGLVTLTPRRMEILEHIGALTNGQELPDIPGLRIFRKPVVR